MAAPFSVEDFHFLRIKPMWLFFKKEHFSFWMICGYMFAEFVRPQEMFPFLPKLPWAQICIMGALIGAFSDKTVKWVSAKPNFWMISFLLALLLSSLVAEYPEVSRRNLLPPFSWIVIYFLIVTIVNTRERLYIFILIYIIASGKIAVGCARIWAMRGFSFSSWGLSGPPGFFQNSGELAVLMVMLFPLTFFIYAELKGRIRLFEKFLLIALWACPVMVVMGASSRGSQIALAIQIIIMARKTLFRPKALAITACIVALLWSILPAEQKERFAETGKDKSSVQRKLYWIHGWDMMREHPFLGVGYYNFTTEYERNYSYDMLYETAQLPHNIFVQVGTDAGFVGLFFYSGLIICMFTIPLAIMRKKEASKMDIAMAIGLGYGALGFLIAGQFVTITYYPFMWINLGMLAALINSIGSKPRSIEVVYHAPNTSGGK